MSSRPDRVKRAAKKNCPTARGFVFRKKNQVGENPPPHFRRPRHPHLERELNSDKKNEKKGPPDRPSAECAIFSHFFARVQFALKVGMSRSPKTGGRFFFSRQLNFFFSIFFSFVPGTNGTGRHDRDVFFLASSFFPLFSLFPSSCHRSKRSTFFLLFFCFKKKQNVWRRSGSKDASSCGESYAS